jgi:hypothetical protein
LQKGVIPSPKLLLKYRHLSIYNDLISAIKLGCLQKYDQISLKYQGVLIKWGTWLVFEQVRLLVVRQLFKKVWLFLDKPSRIPIKTLERGVSISMGKDHIYIEDVCCLVVNLIAKGYMKGYISHEKQILVLSNKDPFPL